jgi:hypothetical protein
MLLKKITTVITLALLITISVPAIAAVPVAEPYSSNSPVKGDDPRAQQLLQRLEDIKKIDKSDLARSEKRKLRKEVKDIRKEMKTISGGVYLSVGAIIIIILLLILLL